MSRWIPGLGPHLVCGPGDHTCMLVVVAGEVGGEVGVHGVGV